MFLTYYELDGQVMKLRSRYLRNNAVYKLRLTVSCPDGKTSVDFSVAVLELPSMRPLSDLNILTSSGATVVSPSEGFAAETVFSAKYCFTASDIVEEISGSWNFGISYYPSDRIQNAEIGWNTVIYR